MDILIIVLSVIVSLLLIGVVLIQKSKGGGLSSSFAGSNQIMGVRRTTDFIEKATWTLASVIAILAIASAFFMKDMNQSSESLRTLNQVATPAPVEAKGQYETEAEKAPAAQPAAETKEPAADPLPGPTNILFFLAYNT